MKLEDQLSNRELSQKLKELGVKQESYFSWVGDEVWDKTMQSDYETGRTVNRSEWYAAFTVAELLEGLPQQVNGFELEMFKHGGGFGVHYYEQWSEERETRFESQWDKNFANALAMMRIYLIENKLVNISAGMEGR